MHKLIILAVTAAFFSGPAIAQAKKEEPKLQDSSKKSEPNTPIGKDREAMPATKSTAPTSGAPMPKNEMQKKQ